MMANVCAACGHSAVLCFRKRDRMLERDFDYFKCENAACAMVWIYPQPSNSELSRIYSKGYIQAWGDYEKNEDLVERQKMASFEQLFAHLEGLKEGSRVL